MSFMDTGTGSPNVSNETGDEQPLFDVFENEGWQREWAGMPEYVQRKTEFHCIKISFVTQDDMKKFSTLIGQYVGLDTKIVYYPRKMVESSSGKLYVDES